MFRAQHQTDPLSQFAGAAAREAGVDAENRNDPEMLRVMKQLLTSFMLTNRILGATYGTDTGISDRRSGQAYYIDVGILIPEAPSGPPAISYTPRVSVNTSRIAELIAPSLGDVDLKFNIGVDAFSIHRTSPLPTNFRSWPVTVKCPLLQGQTGSRYLTVLTGDSGSALSGTAQTVFYGELPSLLEFEFGFQSPIPVDDAGGLTSVLYPLVYNDTYEAVARPPIPVIPGSSVTLWQSSQIYALSLRLYVLPTITPRVRLAAQ